MPPDGNKKSDEEKQTEEGWTLYSESKHIIIVSIRRRKPADVFTGRDSDIRKGLLDRIVPCVYTFHNSFNRSGTGKRPESPDGKIKESCFCAVHRKGSSDMKFEHIFLLGMLVVFLMMWYTNKYYRLPLWKVAVACVFVAVASYYGMKIMFFIESGGKWKGRSFYGTMFMIPLVMYPVAKALKEPYGILLDLVPPAGFLMLAFFKVKCKIDGCCFGRMITVGGSAFRFPSQIVECVAAVILMFVMILIIKSGRWRGYVYAWCLFLYGCTRFALNLLRETTPWIGPFAPGEFWSLIAILLGAAFLLRAKKQRTSMRS